MVAEICGFGWGYLANAGKMLSLSADMVSELAARLFWVRLCADVGRSERTGRSEAVEWRESEWD